VSGERLAPASFNGRNSLFIGCELYAAVAANLVVLLRVLNFHGADWTWARQVAAKLGCIEQFS
jgi:hypothetical protein